MVKSTQYHEWETILLIHKQLTLEALSMYTGSESQTT